MRLIHLLTLPEPWNHHDNLEVACGATVHHPVVKGAIDGEAGLEYIGLGFLGVCPRCHKAIQTKPRRYLYAIIEGQEALEATA